MGFLKKVIDWFLNAVLAVLIVASIWVFVQVFLLASFRISSDSMEPELTEGDFVAVWKPTLGARLFDLNATLRLEQTEIHRMPGFRKAKRGDVLVFNFPHPNGWDKVEMHILKYYIKRCIGLPGDTLSIRNGKFRINGMAEPLGNTDSQGRIGRTLPGEFPDGVYKAFPFDSILNWNIRNFGPLYIPKAGDRIKMNRTNYALYRKLIAYEQKTVIEYRDSTVYLNGKPMQEYCFQKNYYFMAGDKGMNSQDSRYWGLLPEEYIVGKAAFIWKSADPYTGQFRWDRFMKKIR
ncbi:signal peptidase I [Parabacteroides massiliensis]|uniref:signal peptidase I n=1 Tax=Parabacteroides massiliensis TaxID=1750560 RepID=UPI00096A5AEF|nr:signal peptidase I [Parabacteroides massiliensis]